MVNGKERIVKNELMSASEFIKSKTEKENHLYLADVDDSIVDAEEDFSDHEDSEYDDLYCYERIN